MLTLKDALLLTRRAPGPGAKPLAVHLACGFTPLHLQTFLHAELVQAAPARAIKVTVGLYGDVCGNLERLAGGQCDVCVAPLEWSDLGPRPGLRSLGSWRPAELNNILESVRAGLERAAAAIDRLAAFVPVVVSLPTLPLPPVSASAVSSTGSFEIELQAALAEFSRRIWKPGPVRILSAQHLARMSPPDTRLDVTSEISHGFPYTRSHAAILARELGKLALDRRPMKGLITDLDDTLWKGIVGELGPASVHWDLNSGAQIHGLYQRLLASLASAGALVGVASKNDPAVVAQTFERPDLLLRADDVFPKEVGWHPKSESVSRILSAWNIGADSVVFIDDSPMELDEVKRVHPGIQTRQFPTRDPQAAYELFVELRELFGKPAVSGEDAIRAASLRTGQAVNEAANLGAAHLDNFLNGLGQVLSVHDASASTRAFELLNKTNQFNLNGQRHDWAGWTARSREEGTFQWAIGYSDKFGPLGDIAVVAGRLERDMAAIDAWVMSCRAFSRRIEHQSLQLIFQNTGASMAALDHKPTERNGPLREFLATIPHTLEDGRVLIRKCDFETACPALYFTLQDGTAEDSPGESAGDE